MLKEVGASGQISLGKKYAGQLFDLSVQADGSIVMQPVKVVPIAHTAQEKRANFNASPRRRLAHPERLARRAGRCAQPGRHGHSPHAMEEENKEAIEAMNQRMAKIGSMGTVSMSGARTKPQLSRLADGPVRCLPQPH